jgi:hypothetical protein
MTDDERSSRTKRLDRFIRSYPLVLILALLAFLITAGITVGGGVTRAAHWYEHRYNWRDGEYEKLRALRAGYTLQTFEDRLGVPMFQRRSRNRKWIESTFQRRDYWVQAISDHAGTVQAFAVTSCAVDFNPELRLPDSTRIWLNKQTLASVDPDGRTELTTNANYFESPWPEGAYFYDVGRAGDLANNKAFAWGFNDACTNRPEWRTYLTRTSPVPLGEDGEYNGFLCCGGPKVMAFRTQIPVNTYAETAPQASHDFFAPEPGRQGDFHIGVDRNLVGTVLTPSGAFTPRGSTTKADPSLPKPAPGPPPPLLGPPPLWPFGSAELLRVWRCLQHQPPTWFYLFDKSTYMVFQKSPFMVDANQRPPAPIVRAEGGFIGLWSPTVWIGFFSGPSAAKVALSQLVLRERQSSYRIGKTVVLWRGTGDSGTRRAIAHCSRS